MGLSRRAREQAQPGPGLFGLAKQSVPFDDFVFTIPRNIPAAGSFDGRLNTSHEILVSLYVVNCHMEDHKLLAGKLSSSSTNDWSETPSSPSTNITLTELHAMRISLQLRHSGFV
jgi:hypothetical protein